MSLSLAVDEQAWQAVAADIAWYGSTSYLVSMIRRVDPGRLPVRIPGESVWQSPAVHIEARPGGLVAVALETNAGAHRVTMAGSDLRDAAASLEGKILAELRRRCPGVAFEPLEP